MHSTDFGCCTDAGKQVATEERHIPIGCGVVPALGAGKGAGQAGEESVHDTPKWSALQKQGAWQVCLGGRGTETSFMGRPGFPARGYGRPAHARAGKLCTGQQRGGRREDWV